MKKLHYDELLPIVLESLNDALCVSEDELLGISTFFDDIFDDSSVDMDFDGPSFMSDYYCGKNMSLSVSYPPKSTSALDVRLQIGSKCTNPSIANELIDRYMKTKFSSYWSIPLHADNDSGLMMHARVDFSDSGKIYDELYRVLKMFENERFTNELRPFIHYFEK